MRERHIFWDLAPLALLGGMLLLMLFNSIDNHRSWGVSQQILSQQAELLKLNQEILRQLSERRGGAPEGLSANLPPAADTGTQPKPGATAAVSVSMEGLPPGVTPPVLPIFTRGDEHADDGGTLTLALTAEPNSLNPLVDNDATASTLFSRAHDALARTSFDDLSLFEPQLARAWSKAMVCEVYLKDNKEGAAAALASALNSRWDAETRNRIKLNGLTGTRDAQGRELLRLELHDVSSAYREVLKRDAGGQLLPQWWFYIEYKEGELLDGTKINADVVEKKLWTILEKAVPKEHWLPAWKRDGSVILMLLGDEARRDAADAALKTYVAGTANRCKALDPKSTSGMREDTLLTYNLLEDYLAHEAPVFTFYMRRDAKWEDGQPVTGKDVVFTYQTLLNPEIRSGPMRNYFIDCKSCELVNNDPYTVRFVWNKPYYNAFENSASFTPLAEHFYRFDKPAEFNSGPQNQKLLSNSAYKLKTWERGRKFEYVRNENYYGKRPHLERIVYQLVKDNSVALQMFEKGDLDGYALSPSQMAAKEKELAAWEKRKAEAGEPTATQELGLPFMKKFNVNISVANVYRYIGWNERKPLFADKQVRQALTLLLDRERICKEIFRNYALPMHGPCHPETPAAWKEIDKKAWPYAPERARKLLAECGWADTDGDGVLDKDGLKFSFTLLIVSNNPEMEQLANYIKDEFGRAGIKVSVNNLEWSAFLQKKDRLEFDALISGWRVGTDFDPYQLFHSSQTKEKDSNFCGYKNAEADRLMVDARRELDEKARYQLLWRFQEIVLEEQPYTFLAVSKRLVATNKKLQNVEYKLTGAEESRWWIPKGMQ